MVCFFIGVSGTYFVLTAAPAEIDPAQPFSTTASAGLAGFEPVSDTGTSQRPVASDQDNTPNPTASGPVALEGSHTHKPVVEFDQEKKVLIIRIDHAQRLTISAFVLTGQKMNKFTTERFFSPGTHLISLKNRKLADGVVIFKIEGAGFSESKTINLAR